MARLAEHLRELWISQDGSCHYTGRAMRLDGYHAMEANACTVDRVDPSKGYVRGNLVLCCSLINRVKQNLTHAELIALCRELIEASERASCT